MGLSANIASKNYTLEKNIPKLETLLGSNMISIYCNWSFDRVLNVYSDVNFLNIINKSRLFKMQDCK